MTNERYGYAGFKYRHTSFIFELCKQLNVQDYLELGVYSGDTLFKLSTICNVVGVDTQDKFQLRQRFGDRFFQGTTDEFFSQNRRTYDVVFIDADHSFASVKKDFVNSLKILNPMGIILIHDTNPMSEYLKEPGYCGDSWKMHRYLGETWPDLDKINLDITEAGLMMVKRRDEIRCYLGD